MAGSSEIRSVLGTLQGADARALRAASDDRTASEAGAIILAETLGEDDLERAASWILKHWLETRRVAMTSALAAAIAARAVFCRDWEARLHVLQLAGHMDFSTVAVEDFTRFLDESLVDDRRLVRAWAYDAYSHLARHIPAYRPRVEALLDEAERTESAGSIRARLRRIRARGFPARP